MNRPSGLSRFLSAFILGFAILLPVMNKGGTITIYEAIVGLWLLLLIPSYLLHRRLRMTASRRESLKITAATYVIGSSLYSFVEPVVAGYSLGYYIFMIPVLVSFTLMIPSLFVRNRFYNAHPKTDIESDGKYSEYLRKIFPEAVTYMPGVFVNNKPLTLGGNFVTHTDGRVKRILVFPEALEKFSENEIKSAILKKYFDLKNKSGLKLIYKISALAIGFVDGLLVLSMIFPYITNQYLQLEVSFAIFFLTFGFILSFPFLLRKLALESDLKSDRDSVKISHDPESLKSYILKASENYIVSPLAIGKRYERVMKFQKKQAEKRVEKLSGINFLND